METNTNETPKTPAEVEFDLKSIEGQDFDDTLKEIHFTIKGKPHILREMAGTLRDQYNDELFSEYMRRDGDTWVTFKHDGLYAILLSRSIIGPDGNFISMEVAKNYPSDLQTKLYLAARKISHLDVRKAKAEAAKNS
jgi:hypothetical protein